jgi:peptidoglycan/LPS O-acetylase OafA/YrhL
MSSWFYSPLGNYRPDIDGLRAVAVLSVIVFHIWKESLPGGFVGVDIFFVISGFLITRNILIDLERGKFSILDFYRRRVKRIAPALLVVVLISLVAAQLLLLPEDTKSTAQSAVWSLLSLANVYFWLYQDTSYFSADSGTIPLLHLWSLGVEEQFYIIWPLLLLLAFRPARRKSFFWWAILIAMLSFVLGEVLFAVAPSFVYYMLPTRAGELLIGALAAIIVLRGAEQRLPATIVGFMAPAGLMLLAFSLFLLSEAQVFPGLRALLPTIGTFLLILAGQHGANPISRLLTLRPLVWIGLISYSAYLWHWPLLAFFRYGYSQVTIAQGVVLFVLTLVLAWLSYYFVEQPARRSKESVWRVIVYQYVLPAGSLAVVALAIQYNGGYGFRSIAAGYMQRLSALRESSSPAFAATYVCQKGLIRQEDADATRCVIGDRRAGPVDALLWGDSNAAHYIGMIGAFAEKSGFSFRNLIHSACPPIDGDPESYVIAARLSDCRRSLDVARPVVDAFDQVIISASWSTYQSRHPSFLAVFFETVKRLAENGKRVVLIGKIPDMRGYDRLCAEKALSYPLLNCSLVVPVSASHDILAVNSKLRDFAERTTNVEYFDATSYLCPNELCSSHDSAGQAQYYDQRHLALSASWRLGAEIIRQSGVPNSFSAIRMRANLADAPSREHGS